MTNNKALPEMSPVDQALTRQVLEFFGVAIPSEMQRAAALALVRAMEIPGTRPLGVFGRRH